MSGTKIIEWQSLDHDLSDKKADWYISVIVVGLSISIGSLLLNNLLFAIFCLLATISIIIHAAKKPELIDFYISTQGVQIRHDFFPYPRIHSFWIKREKNKNQIIFHSDRNVLPHLIVPINDIDPEDIRIVLRQHLPERYDRKNLIDKTLEYLGF